MKKDFDNWNRKKQTLDSSNHRPPFVSEGDIWWVSIGENIGSEVSGKSQLFTRPAIVLKKLAHSFYFVIPTTTKEHNGSWYVPFAHRGKSMFACLHQSRAVDHRRLSSKLGALDDEDYTNICSGFVQLYVPKNNIPRKKRGRGKIPNV